MRAAVAGQVKPVATPAVPMEPFYAKSATKEKLSDDFGRDDLAFRPFTGYAAGMHNRSSKKNPTDLNQLAKSIVDAATGDVPAPEPPDQQKDPAAVSLGRRGGLKGGKARAASLSAKRRKEIAKKAAAARWGKG